MNRPHSNSHNRSHTPRPHTPRRLSAAEVGKRRQLGVDGEAAAAKWYQDRGWKILERNWRFGRGELDIIVACGQTIVFCEVKTRSSTNFAWPAEAVNRKKQIQIRKLAACWLEQCPKYHPVVRFDVAEVYPQQGRLEVVVYEDAF